MTDARIDLASRSLGGRVVWVSDELFADRRHLIAPGAPHWSPDTYGPDGKVYDGWETRRRRDVDGGLGPTLGHDEAIVALGAPGVVEQVVVDTAFFRGNFPPFASVEAVAVHGYPSIDELRAAAWTTIVPKSSLEGDSVNTFDVADASMRRRSWTHVRLSIYPDGGVARLRVLGRVVPDPAFLTGTIDVAGLTQGGQVLASSNTFYSPAGNLILPGEHATIAEGWETARRRDGGHEWVLFALAGATRLRTAVLDTTHYTGNSPGAARLRGLDARGRANPLDLDCPAWAVLLERTHLRPDTRHRFALPAEPEVTHVLMDVYPDGGMGRVRIFGELTEPPVARKIRAR